MPLDTTDHDRGSAGLEYVYPVVSRRSGGVSVGVNLNPNKACNWRCVYCQVPGLSFGKGPPIDLERLRAELAGFLRRASAPAWLEEHAPAGARRLTDVAVSGDRIHTSSPDFAAAVDAVGSVLGELALALPVVLITNGSLVQRREVRRGLERLAALDGTVWFKIDSATEAGQRAVNSAAIGPERTLANLAACARLCRTWIQTCVFRRGGAEPAPAELDAYIELLRSARAQGIALEGVQLYGLARPSHQPEAAELEPLPRSWMDEFARRIERAGLRVRSHA